MDHVQYAVFADSGYVQQGNYLYRPHTEPADAAETLFNVMMSKCRVAVEWTIGKVGNIWP